MEYQDYLELRRRAEKRLTSISAWPFVAFQSIAFTLMFMRSSQEFYFAFLAGCGGLVFTAGTLLLVRKRTAANRERRRDAIDETLEGTVETGWPIEEPSPRELRLLASLLDDDLETRAGFGKAMVWLSAIGAALWLPAFLAANTDRGIIPFQGTGFEFFVLWLLMLGGTALYQRRVRHAASRRVQAALDRATVWSNGKRRRPSEAAWWNDEDDAADEKPKRAIGNDEVDARLGDDGEINNDVSTMRRRLS